MNFLHSMKSKAGEFGRMLFGKPDFRSQSLYLHSYRVAVDKDTMVDRYRVTILTRADSLYQAEEAAEAHFETLRQGVEFASQTLEVRRLKPRPLVRSSIKDEPASVRRLVVTLRQEESNAVSRVELVRNTPL
jgi:hypothetical protein